MKKTSLILMFILVMQLIGCNKTDDGVFTEPITMYEKMVGTWTISKVAQKDLIAIAASSKPDQILLTNKFDFKTFTITLNADEKFTPTTFEVGGTSPQLFLQSGYWKLNNPFPNTDGKPLVIELYSDEAKTVLIDELSISTVPGAKKTLVFDLIRESNGVAYVDYEYSLKAN
jgi:hypothetical protein